MKNSVIAFVLILFLVSCSRNAESDSSRQSDIPSSGYPELMNQVWDAHGGLDKWKRFQFMKYTMRSGENSPEETHMINLGDRRIRIESDSFTLGMDGEQIWVAPSVESFGRDPRFYHNLMFYFYSIPFVMSDPGVNVEDAGMKMHDSVSYRALHVFFEEGTGDADDDEYILLINPESERMEWLLYTVTYFSGEPADSYNALHYSDYQNINGLVMPAKLIGYTYANDTTGSVRYSSAFYDVSFSEEPMEDSKFMKPEQAEYYSQ